MGDRLVGRPAGQHPDLTDLSGGRPAVSPLGGFVLAWLAIDGVISAVLATLFLQIRVATFPFPISALVCGVVNAALVWAGLQWTTSRRLAAISLWAWLATIAVLMFGGPGGDIAFGGPGFDAYSVVLLLVVGAVPPVIVLRRAVSRVGP